MATMAWSSLFSNPFTLIIFQRFAIALLAGFIHSNSLLRPLIFLILVSWNLQLLPIYQNYFSKKILIVFIAGEAICTLLHYIEKILLNRWSFDAHYPQYTTSSTAAKTPAPDVKKVRKKSDMRQVGSIWDRLRFGAWIAFSDRHPALNATRYADSKIPFFSRVWQREVTAEECAVRVMASAGWRFSTYLVVQADLSAYSLIGVMLGVSRPELERPIFGNFGKAYTVRGFWSKSWHQLQRWRLVTVADLVTYDVLKLPRSASARGKGEYGSTASLSRLVARYLHLTVCFLVSGLAHHVLDVAVGMRWRDSGATMFFVMMAPAIMLEDAVQWIWSNIAAEKKPQENGKLMWSKDLSGSPRNPDGDLWKRLVGYLWVITWSSITTPWYAYPTLSRNKGEGRDAVLPLSIIEYIGLSYVGRGKPNDGSLVAS
ncbi:hypothetical protein G7Y79_00033g067980 [Physcia stellaris]|nr:hypothetical protein G7Y79_00033g067980 [Physcia stellaris]